MKKTVKTHYMIGLIILLTLVMAPPISSQGVESNLIQQTAEVVFASGPSLIPADTLFEILNDGDNTNDPYLISLRSAEDYARGHIPGAVHMDLETLFSEQALVTIPPERDIVVICYSGQSAGQAVAALNMLGYNASAFAFGMSSWTMNPDVFVKRFDPQITPRDYPVEQNGNQPKGTYSLPAPPKETILASAQLVFSDGAGLTSADALFEILNDGDNSNDPTIISIRTPQDYAAGHIPGTIWKDISTLFTLDELATIPTDRPVVVVCYTGQSASQASAALELLGYDATALAYGMSGWTRDPQVYFKRFDPVSTPRDYPITSEPTLSTNTFSLAEPRIAIVTPEPTPAPTQAPAQAPVSAPIEQPSANCVACHTNDGIMQGLTSTDGAQSELTTGQCCAVELPPMAAWQKLYVGDADFLSSIHNSDGCTGCHGGQDGVMDRNMAHRGLIPDPTTDPTLACGGCHSTEVEMSWSGLHLDLSGFKTVLEARGADMENPHMQQAYGDHCYSCHASCGQCHVSRPTFTGGGLISGHQIVEFPQVEETCMACHGARVATEYMGLNASVPASVHFEQGMDCYACHNITQFHGSGSARTHRYDGEGMPSCEGCHEKADPSQTAENLSHDIHWDTVACSVCHVSGPYQNCYGCHVGTDALGLPFQTLDENRLEFKIGRNPMPSEDHPWKYVLLRHVPVEPDTFAFYDDGLLMDFDALPTWKLATPHSIQRITPQNDTCNNCHGNAELFLTIDDVRPARWEANADVIVDQVPPETELGIEEEETKPLRECVGQIDHATHVIPETCQPELCTQCHPGTFQGDWSLANENIHTLYALVEPKGETIVCQDCHAPDGNFDWAAEGYDPEEIDTLVWDDFGEITPVEHTSSSPIWVIGIGIFIFIAAATPALANRDEQM